MIGVLHVAQPVEGGVAVYVAAVAADQARRGWDVAVACPGRGRLPAELAALGVRWLEWEAGRSPGPGVPGEARRLRRLLGRFRPDAVHLHSAKAGLVGRAVIRGAVPTLFQPHGWSWLAARGATARAALAWERAATRWTSLLVCVGEGEADLARSHGLRGDVTVVRNGVDLGRFRPAGPGVRTAARALLGVPERVPLAVCPGRVTRQKGQDLLVAAWGRVRAEVPGARLAIVGDGDLRPVLRSCAGPGIAFADAVADLRPWYAAADVVVLPSRWEGLPLTALEALASGRPLVASAVPGLSEVVTGEVGALVPAGDPAALAEAVAVRLRHPGLAAREGEAGIARAADFDVRPALDRLASLTAAVTPAAGGTGGGCGAGVGSGGGTRVRR
ncbi:glycosyltransferase [Planobispora rosea]|uniref:glycosyltransferase n=1 Tax=Planobispora rosea TaxID=35762 RepID=UPI000AE4D5FB